MQTIRHFVIGVVCISMPLNLVVHSYVIHSDELTDVLLLGWHHDTGGSELISRHVFRFMRQIPAIHLVQHFLHL